jgi:NodT family efflux transporter outer membrane factor (OMF) lipoprotein
MRSGPLATYALLLAIGGCAVGPSYHTPRPDVPARFAAAADAAGDRGAAGAAGTAGGGAGALAGGAARGAAPAGGAPAVDPALWWHALADPELDSLVERAVKSNLDIESSLLRLQQARTYEAVVVGHALPEADASAAEGRGTGSDLSRARAAQPLHSADDAAGLSHLNTLVGFDAVWELDVFGKYRRAIQAARFDTQAAAQARYGVITAVIADVARAYVDLRASQLQLQVLRQAADLLRESLRIVSIRYQRGITNELDVALATREFDAVQAQLAPAEAQVKASEYAIAVLIGAYPETLVQELEAPGLIPTLPGVVAAGAPLDLLRRRPDIQQAERELGASTARIGVATAELFPQVALVGSIGAQRGTLASTGRTVGQHVWSFGPAALWPLLDFGAIDAEVDIADLEAQRSLVSYRASILNAVQEVDAALDAYAAAQSQLEQLGGAVLAAQRAVDLATQRYQRGLTDFLNVVDAQRQFYDIQGQYVSAQRSQAEQFVQLYRSLGGGWEGFRTVPPIRQPQPAVIAAFRRLLGG